MGNVLSKTKVDPSAKVAPSTLLTFKCTCPEGLCQNEPKISKPEPLINKKLSRALQKTYNTRILPMLKYPLTSYRMWFGSTYPISAYVTMMLDAEYFTNRVWITHSGMFEKGTQDPLYQLAEKEPGLVIKDLAKFQGCGPQSLFKFITGKTLDLCRRIEIKMLKMIVKRLNKTFEAKQYAESSDIIKGMLATFESNFVVANANCRYITPIDCPYKTIEERFYNIIDKRYLRYSFRPEEKNSIYYNGHSVPLYLDPTFYAMKSFRKNLKNSPLRFTFGVSEEYYCSFEDQIPFLPMIISGRCSRGDSRPLENAINRKGVLDFNTIRSARLSFTYPESEMVHYEDINFAANYKEHLKYNEAENRIPKELKEFIENKPCRYI